ncbi:hypothetical protein WJX81_006279 [Elliptochloris bilobata]|uniref:Uncharacterized protein n=1 Tax=Elliptochloris bilobata TaxID=381761 RepID=A0AAW1QV76_9CHLO
MDTFEYCSTSDYTSPSSAEADSVLEYSEREALPNAAPIDRSLGLLLRYLGAADLCLARTDQLAAALWIAIKFDTPRACVPSRTLMAQATAVPAALLSATEMDILVGLRFDVLNGSMVSRE